MQRPTPLSILVIEDHLPDYVLLEEGLLLSKIGISAIRHIKSLAALPLALLQQKPDVVFLDLSLPDAQGNNTLDQVIALAPDVAIIIMSEETGMATGLKALAAGAQDYLIKGDFDHKLLAKTVLYSIERKKSLEMLRISNERLEVISDATNDMVWEWNLQTGEIYHNPIGHQKVYGYPADCRGKVFEEWICSVHPDDAGRITKGFAELMENPAIKTYQHEFRFCLPQGEIIYIHDRGSVLRDKAGRVVRLIGASQNITDRKKAESKLQSSEHRFKSLVQNGSDLISIVSERGDYNYVSPTTKHLLGYEADYLLGKNAFEFIHSADYETILGYLQKVIEHPCVELPPFRFQHANGTWRWIRTKLTNMLNDPSVGGIVTTSWDITEAIQLQEELHRLSLVAKETVNGVVITDAAGVIIWVNNSFTKCTGYTLEECSGRRPGSFLQGPDSNPVTIDYLHRQINAQQPFDCEIINYHKNGSRIWLRLQGQPIFDECGKMLQFFALQTDITAEKQARLEAERHKEQFRALIQNSFDVVEIIDANGKVAYVSPSVERIFGFRPQDLLNKPGFAYVHPDDREFAMKRLLHLTALSGNTDALTIRLRHVDGHYRYCEILAKNLLDNTHIKGIVLNIRDVQDELEAKNNLQISELNYRLLFEGNPQPMWIVHRHTYAFIEVNTAALNLYGFSREEFAAMTNFDIRDGNEVEKLSQWQASNNKANGQVYHAGEWKHNCKSGAQIIVEISASLISYREEEVMLLLINNITEKKKLEQKLVTEKLNRQKQITAASIQMQEKEREYIGRELHDNVNQILTAAKLRIEYACAEEQLKRTVLNQGKDYLLMAMTEIRKLSKALVPPSLDEVGLKTAIGDLLESFTIVKDLKLNVAIDIDETRLNEIQKLTLYRIIQEQVSNILKYAGASELSIWLAQNLDTVCLAIADNGVGFNQQEKKKGIGLANIKARIKALSGNTTIDTTPGGGCRLSVSFPVSSSLSEVGQECD